MSQQTSNDAQRITVRLVLASPAVNNLKVTGGEWLPPDLRLLDSP